MKKIYEEKELLFAILSIVIYVVLFGNLRSLYGDGDMRVMIGTVVYSAVILLFLAGNHLFEKYGFTSVPSGRKYLYFIPFVLMISVNLWFGAVPHYQGMNQVYGLVTMALVGFLEEIIFRGFLFRAVEKKNRTRAIIISAVTFGAGHIVNLLTGHGSIDTVFQMLYAFGVGLCFALVFAKSGSIWPAVITHSLIDMTHLYSNTNLSAHTELLWNTAGTIFLLAVSALYSIYLMKMKEETES